MGVRIGVVWCPIEVCVDSGVAYIVLHAQIADGLGFDYHTGHRVYLCFHESQRVLTFE
jgi:hypothetical protein